jgi:hypothetical protein
MGLVALSVAFAATSVTMAAVITRAARAAGGI